MCLHGSSYHVTIRGTALALLAALVFLGCGTGSEDKLPTANISSPDSSSPDATLAGLPDADAIIANPATIPPHQPRKNLHPEVMIRTSLGSLKVRLDAEKASETVDNFLGNYVERAHYDNMIFHYVEEGFIAIGGAYTTDLKARESRAPIRNEAHNGLKNTKGTIAMSRQGEYVDSATSLFFLNLADNPALDHDPDGGDEKYGYCVFGEVVEGMDVLDRIAKADVREQGDFPNMPVEQIVIESIRLID